MKSLQRILDLACRERSCPWALATLVRTAGSTYRKPGARLLVHENGDTTGVLSGGCLEEAIGRIGQEVMAGDQSRLVAFDTRKLYGCDGKLEIFVERIESAGVSGNLLTAIAEKFTRREICRVRTPFSDPDGHSELLPDKALVVERPDTFVQMMPLPPRLLLFGSGPELAPMRFFAAGLGWEVQEHFHPDELPDDFKTDAQTAAIVMTHNFGRDLAALARLLPLGLRYLGLLGPKKRHSALLAQFQEFRELDPAWLDALHAPAGLDIGSESPEEISLSIVSEIAAVLASREGGSLRHRAFPIHEPAISKEA